MMDPTDSQRPERRLRRFALPLGLGVLAAQLTLLAFLPTLQNGFVNWDDKQTIYENSGIRSLDLSAVARLFTKADDGYWYPLTFLSFAVDYAIWGLRAEGFHLTNSLLHAANTFLVFITVLMLARRASGASGGEPVPRGALAASLSTALLFGLHPMRVESVAWASERKDVLYAFFFLLAILAYLRFAAGTTLRRVAYAGSLACFALALMSKPMAVTLPFILLIFDYYPLNRLRFDRGQRRVAFRLVLEKLPYFAMSAGIALVTYLSYHRAADLETLPLRIRLAGIVRRYAFYLYKTAWPSELAPFYPISRSTQTPSLSPEIAAHLTLLLCVTVVCLVAARTRKVYLAAWLFYLMTLLPVIGFVQAGGQGAADRFSYLASLGVLTLVGAGVGRLVERASRWWHFAAIAAPVGASLGLLALLTINQIGVWKDDITLWSQEIRVMPKATTLPYHLRGTAYLRAGRYRDAVSDLTTVIELTPRSMGGLFVGTPRFAQYGTHAIPVYLSRAYANVELRAFDEAVSDYTQVLTQVSGSAEILASRGVAHEGAGRIDAALRDYSEAIRAKPDFADFYVTRGLAYEQLANRRLALSDFERAVRLHPAHGLAHYHLARVYSAFWNSQSSQAEMDKARKLGIRPGTRVWLR